VIALGKCAKSSLQKESRSTMRAAEHLLDVISVTANYTRAAFLQRIGDFPTEI
jgi:hypothetical protein